MDLRLYIGMDIMRVCNVVRFLGDSRSVIREFPRDARQEAGYQLERIQDGLQAEDFKPMHPIGPGVEEIRISGESGAYRVVYLARLE